MLATLFASCLYVSLARILWAVGCVFFQRPPTPYPLPPPRVPISDDDAPYDPANEPYAKGVTRGQICAFMTGFSSFLRETQVTVKSVMHFMPGMRMAIATQAEDVSVFQR